MNWLDYFIVAAHLLLALGLGLYSGRHQSPREFLAACLGWLGIHATDSEKEKTCLTYWEVMRPSKQETKL